MEAERFAQFTLSIDMLQKSVKQIKLHYAPQFGVKGVHTFWVYLLLSHPEGLTAAELASQGMIDRSLVSRELNELEKGGLIVAEGGGRHGYNRRITLTEKGVQIARGIADCAYRVQERADEGITNEELECFYSTLDKLCANFSRIASELPSNASRAPDETD